MDAKPFKEIVAEQMQHKNLTLEKMATSTGIAERHLRALLEAKAKELPAAPYVRGYIGRIAELLELNGNDLWRLYKQEVGAPSSGAHDRLPVNRYALKNISRRFIAISVVALLLVIYVGFNAARLFGTPRLTIVNPVIDDFVTTSDTLTITGTVDPGDSLMIGGEAVLVDPDGQFHNDYKLQLGLNQVEFVAKRLLGKQVKVIRRVIYQPKI